jgi:glutamyl-tRNA synthetase
MLEDLRWFGFAWHEGPDVGGPCASYHQSDRKSLYRSAFEHLRRNGWIYPCTCSRRDILNALSAPHFGDEEPVYPGTCRPTARATGSLRSDAPGATRDRQSVRGPTQKPELRRKEPSPNWRFRITDREPIRFIDAHYGPQEFVAGVHFGDFIVWRHDEVPAYQLAVVVDDHDMGVTEVVRGKDLLLSTARQLLLYRALGWSVPAFCHCPLLTDDRGIRLAKRHDALSLRTHRLQGATPAELRQNWRDLP